MEGRLLKILIRALSVVIISIVAMTALATDVYRMTKEELKPKLGNPDIVIVDVRIGRDWKASEVKIKGAIREDVQKVDSWAKKYSKGKTFVLYCA